MKQVGWLVFAAVLSVGAAGAALMAARPAPPDTAAPAPGSATAGLRTADAGRGGTLFRTCAACHSVGRGGPDVDGPNLYGVVGAPVAGRRPRYGYTQALRDVGGIWTEARLDAWLTDPAAFAPGTAMRFAGLKEAGDRADIIAFLAAQAPARK